MVAALRRSRGRHRGAVEKSGLADSCRREAAILPSGGLGKAWEDSSYIEDWLFSKTREVHEVMVTSF